MQNEMIETPATSEVARILAAGFVRMRRREMSKKAILRTWGEKVLDFPFDKSVNCETPVQGGEN